MIENNALNIIVIFQKYLKYRKNSENIQSFLTF